MKHFRTYLFSQDQKRIFFKTYLSENILFIEKKNKRRASFFSRKWLRVLDKLSFYGGEIENADIEELEGIFQEHEIIKKRVEERQKIFYNLNNFFDPCFSQEEKDLLEILGLGYSIGNNTLEPLKEGVMNAREIEDFLSSYHHDLQRKECLERKLNHFFSIKEIVSQIENKWASFQNAIKYQKGALVFEYYAENLLLPEVTYEIKSQNNIYRTNKGDSLLDYVERLIFDCTKGVIDSNRVKFMACLLFLCIAILNGDIMYSGIFAIIYWIYFRGKYFGGASFIFLATFLGGLLKNCAWTRHFLDFTFLPIGTTYKGLISVQILQNFYDFVKFSFFMKGGLGFYRRLNAFFLVNSIIYLLYFLPEYLVYVVTPLVAVHLILLYFSDLVTKVKVLEELTHRVSLQRVHLIAIIKERIFHELIKNLFDDSPFNPYFFPAMAFFSIFMMGWGLFTTFILFQRFYGMEFEKEAYKNKGIVFFENSLYIPLSLVQYVAKR